MCKNPAPSSIENAFPMYTSPASVIVVGVPPEVVSQVRGITPPTSLTLSGQAVSQLVFLVEYGLLVDML